MGEPISARISERISLVIAGVPCPSCGEVVVPKETSAAPSAVPDRGGPRFSYIWLAPSGPVCPKCNFPMGRYASRLLWIRMFMAGVVLLTASLFLTVLGMLTTFAGWIGVTLKVVFAIGALVIGIGGIGIVVGRRRR